MIKKYKNFIIKLPPIKITLYDILKILNIVKKNKLGIINIYKDENKESINLKNINKEIIYNLIIDISAKNRKDNFKICLLKKESYIQYHNEIDSDKLLILLKIEEILKEKKFLSIPKKISSNIQLITSLFLMIYISIQPIIKSINNILLNIPLVIFLFLLMGIFFLDSDTIIIVRIKNKFKRFYYRYYSINNLIKSIITSSIFIFSIFITNYLLTKFKS